MNDNKPVRFASNYITAEKGKVDGRGNREVTFKIQFSLADENDQTTVYRGGIKWKIYIWVPGIGHSDPQLDFLYGRKASVHETYNDLRELKGDWTLVEPDKFYRATDKERRNEIWYEIGLRPIKLKIDVVEWRYNYELWFQPSPKGVYETWLKPGGAGRPLYDGHKSQYWSLELR